MSANPSANAEATGGEIFIRRILAAPRTLVFKAWTDPQHLARWFGPNDFTVPHVALDLRVGGKWRIGIRSPEGRDYAMHGVYREIVVPERLVFTHIWEEGHDSPNHETLITIKLAESAGKTTLTFHKAILKDLTAHASQTTGWNQCLDRLGVYMAGYAQNIQGE